MSMAGHTLIMSAISPTLMLAAQGIKSREIYPSHFYNSCLDWVLNSFGALILRFTAFSSTPSFINIFRRSFDNSSF